MIVELTTAQYPVALIDWQEAADPAVDSFLPLFSGTYVRHVPPHFAFFLKRLIQRFLVELMELYLYLKNYIARLILLF